MWLSLFTALLTYLLSPRGSDAEKRKALTNAAIAGGAAYVATEYTDWGREISGEFDDAIGVGGSTTTIDDAATGATATGATGSGGGLGSFGNWVTGGLAVGAGAATVNAMPKWVLWAALGLGAYLLLKD